MCFYSFFFTSNNRSGSRVSAQGHGQDVVCSTASSAGSGKWSDSLARSASTRSETCVAPFISTSYGGSYGSLRSERGGERRIGAITARCTSQYNIMATEIDPRGDILQNLAGEQIESPQSMAPLQPQSKLRRAIRRLGMLWTTLVHPLLSSDLPID